MKLPVAIRRPAFRIAYREQTHAETVVVELRDGNLVGRAEFIFFSHDPSAAGWLEPWKWPSAIRFGRFFMAIH